MYNYSGTEPRFFTWWAESAFISIFFFQIALLSMSQRFHLDYLETVLQTALQGCRNIQTVLDEVVRRYVEQAISI